MRYRPIGSTGSAVSSLCLTIGAEQLSAGPGTLKSLIFSALEAGINAYHIDQAEPKMMQAIGEALSHVERRLIWVGLTLGQNPESKERDFSPDGLTRTVEEGLHYSGLAWFDVAVLDQPAEDELPLSSLNALKLLRNNNKVRMLGIRGDDPVMDAYVSTGAFNVLYTPFSIEADWQVRTRMRAAQKRDMAIFIYGYDGTARLGEPQSEVSTRKKGFFGLGTRKLDMATAPITKNSAFAFLHDTPSWTARDICLAFALTEPSVSSALISVTDSHDLEVIAAVPERDLPSGMSAQIEMARVV